jgi:hypothetical protein
MKENLDSKRLSLKTEGGTAKSAWEISRGKK